MRDPRAGYFQSLDVLKAAKACGVYTKSSIMLGLGETHDEIIDTMYDLKDAVRAALASLAGHSQALFGLLACADCCIYIAPLLVTSTHIALLVHSWMVSWALTFELILLL